MRLSRLYSFLIMMACATTAFAQYGLYGSPDTINVSQQTPYMAPSNGYTAPSGGYSYPAQPAYVAQQPVQTYSNQPVQQPYSYQPAQPYPTQAMQGYQVQQTPVQQAPMQQAQIQPQMQPQMQPARPAAVYGQMTPQYRAPNYSRQPYYTAAANQNATAQPQVIPTPNPTPAPQIAPNGQNIYEPEAPGIQPNSNMMNQMLAEQGQISGSNACITGSENGPVYGGDQCGAYRPYTNQYEQAACGNAPDSCTGTSLWYGSVSALAMTRDRPNMVYLTYETGNLPHNVYPPDEFSWRWGGEITFGRRFCNPCATECGGCNTGYWALEASYWTLYPFNSFVSHTSPASPTNPNGTVGTPLRVSDVQFDGTPATTWFDNAAEHRLWRRDEIHNIEVNLVRGQWSYGQDSPWDLGWEMGVRYFRFQESWRFGSVMGGHSWGEGGGAFEAYLSDQITNNLVGPQIGFDLGYSMYSGMRFFLAPKFGLFNNNINNNFQAYLGDGTIATTGTSGVPGTYPVNSSTNTLSFLTQIDVGLDWKFARQWSAQVGYRVVAISGIGLSDAQIPFYIVDIPVIADIDRNADLILHGAFATISYNF